MYVVSNHNITRDIHDFNILDLYDRIMHANKSSKQIKQDQSAF